MYSMEVENMETGSKSTVYAETQEEMHQTLMDKGYACLIKYGCYAGHNTDGEEISVTYPAGLPASKLREVNK